MANTLAGQLVERFGRPEAMKQLYADDIRWSLSASLGKIAGPHEGLEAVLAFNHRIWEAVYFPEVEVEILDEVGDEASSAVRFIYRATYRNNGAPYANHYTLFVRTRDGCIHEVFEALDTLASINAYAGHPADHNPYRDGGK
jgi:ketosteroid isomerase-like protein